jgi:putative ABC transport system substrate-binding protein
MPLFTRVLLVGLTLATLAPPLAAEAQAAKIPRIGVLSLDSPTNSVCVDALRRGLDELGYVEGRTYLLDLRWAEDRVELLPTLAADLVRTNVDLIVSASGPAAVVWKDTTTSIPVVLASSFYPVESGVIASLAHPGGNVTGVTHFTPELMAKRVQLLKEVAPRASRFAVLRLPGRLQDLVVAARCPAAGDRGAPCRRSLSRVRRRGRRGRPGSDDHAGARIAQLALKHRLPSLSGEPNAAADGALLFYGPNVFEGCPRAVRYIDRILKGTRPADLPVEQPTKFDLIINLKPAKALGVTISPSLLLRADEVIQ